jgi:hypothetical protein
MPAARSRNVRREGIVRAVERGASAAGGVVLQGEPLDSHQAEATGASHWQRAPRGGAIVALFSELVVTCCGPPQKPGQALPWRSSGTP